MPSRCSRTSTSRIARKSSTRCRRSIGRAIKRSLDFPEDTAGRLMQTTLVTVPPFWTAGRAIDMMRDAPADELPDEFYEIFIVDPAHRLLGNVFLDALMRAQPDVMLGEMMRTDRRRVTVSEEAQAIAELFERYNLVSGAGRRRRRSPSSA